MAKTYSQLLQGIEVLKRQAEERRRTEVAGVIKRIRQAIEFYGLTATDLGFGAAGSKRAALGATRKSSRRSSVMYRDAAGNTWTGRGPRPRWLKDALASGQTLEQLRQRPPVANAPRGTKKKGRKAGRTPKFGDAEGNTWGGMGKRPQWLRDALASGKRLEDFLVARGNEGQDDAS
jgi:DNA-binding protein H-NS